MSGFIYIYMKNYYNVSSVRLMRFLYALGFAKESYFDKKGNEHWKFEKSDLLMESVEFYKQMRARTSQDYL